MYKRGDFHIHSTFSDGGLSPGEIVHLAKQREVDIISITDHNNTDGVDEAIEEGMKVGIRVIPGVELSTKYNECRVHILGYFKDDSYKNELLREVLFKVKHKRISDIRNIFDGAIDFCGYKNKICVKTGIDILRFFGATVVLAHPVLLCNRDLYKILNLNFDGIEAKYFKNTEEDTKYFINFANERGIIYTAGSDFHDYIEYYRIHGMIGDVYLDEKEIERFLNVLI
ncbi:PHP domain-containing protein [Clostridium celatum]|uniref:PHP domain protein n=1 Tax=Clostridium celatum DSM 1785 TaxID=545697 RepID=L1QK68_9CLOT|nr:PHP domain-containing protein [Clostridium celatum]EKY28321.1 PHP domain protein [Clostridium celatum DSM 1785]MCE9655277.1 PHP domain-containing protein [Clostridium celatum]MDU2265479.1 PHP domain-containing protein [Clostridium celatum]MDU6295209.1 PHP domain-containing protein [Clostridium celatum]MDY3361180.1 PHP domain-containing protein [Clostridium celatum]